MFGSSGSEEAPELHALSIKYAKPESEAHKGDKAAKNIVLIHFRLVLRHSLDTFEHALIVIEGYKSSA